MSEDTPRIEDTRKQPSLAQADVDAFCALEADLLAFNGAVRALAGLLREGEEGCVKLIDVGDLVAILGDRAGELHQRSLDLAR